MKKVLLLILPIILFACGGTSDDKKGGTLDLSEYGLEATIEAGETEKVKAVKLTTNYELKVLKKSISIELKNDLTLTIQEAKGNDVAQKVDFSSKFGDEVLDSGKDYFIIKSEKMKGNINYDCSYYAEHDGIFFEVRIADKSDYFSCISEEQAREGLKIAKTLKFK